MEHFDNVTYMTHPLIKHKISRLRDKNTGTTEFRKLVDTNQDVINKLNIPVLIIHGTNDDIVPCNSSIKIFDKIPSLSKKLLLVKNLSHRVFKDVKQNEIISETVDFLNNKNKEMILKERI